MIAMYFVSETQRCLLLCMLDRLALWSADVATFVSHMFRLYFCRTQIPVVAFPPLHFFVIARH